LSHRADDRADDRGGDRRGVARAPRQAGHAGGAARNSSRSRGPASGPPVRAAVGRARETGPVNGTDEATRAAPANGSGDADGPAGWLVLVYRVPSEPTRLRATVWRRLKGLGAIYLQNSVAALPAGPAAERALRLLRREILDMKGTASLLACSVLAGENEIRAAFQAARNDEYEEIIDKCRDFVAGIRKEFRAEHFTYAELEENDEDLIKLRNWFAKITARDVFGGPSRQACEKALAVCERELEGYSNWVYAGESEGTGSAAAGSW
jgi:hypothetical protein